MAPEWVTSIRGNWGDHFRFTLWVLDQFEDLWRAPKQNFGQIMTFPDPSCQSQPSQIAMVQNGLYTCPKHSTTFFIRPESGHWQPVSLTDSLNHWLSKCRLLNLIYVLRFCSDFEQRVYFLHLDFEVEDLYNEEIFYVGKKLVKLTEIMWYR